MAQATDAAATGSSEPAREGADSYGANDAGSFDGLVFAVLLAVVLFVAVSNLWLRWRAQGEEFVPALRRRLAALTGRRPPPPAS